VTGCAAHNIFAPDASDVCLTALQAGLLRPAAAGTFVVRVVPTRTPALIGGGGAAVETGAVLAGVEFQGCTANGMLLCFCALVHPFTLQSRILIGIFDAIVFCFWFRAEITSLGGFLLTPYTISLVYPSCTPLASTL
jgi:hypothetical protein